MKIIKASKSIFTAFFSFLSFAEPTPESAATEIPSELTKLAEALCIIFNNYANADESLRNSASTQSYEQFCASLLETPTKSKLKTRIDFEKQKIHLNKF